MTRRDTDRDRTIADFGDQWTRHTGNAGYYGSAALFDDILQPFLTSRDFAGKRCADIGSGTGRIVRMMLAAGAAHVTAVEPSRAYDALVENTADARDRVACLNLRGEELPAGAFDIVLSIGVLHHIPDPKPVVDRAWHALRDGGTMLIWLYGHEGSRLYRAIFQPVRLITRLLPVAANQAIAAALYPIALGYGLLARRFPALPLSDYFANVYLRFGKAERKLVILDQINPRWAKYYTGEEAGAVLRASDFADIRCHHRRGYSWTVCGVKRAAS